MKNSSRWRILSLTVLVLWGLFALLLTTQSDRVPIVSLMVRSVGSTEVGATIGHAGLFGSLTLLSYMALATFIERRPALLLALVWVLIIASGTEIYQTVVDGRDTSLSDFLANWLGVFIVSFGIAYSAMRKDMLHTPSNVGQS